MINKWFEEDKIEIFVILCLVLCLAIGWTSYVSFGHQLIKAIYEDRSIGFLNRMITGQSEHPLEFYYEKAGMWFRMFPSFMIIVLISTLVYLLFIKRKIKPEDRYFFFFFAMCLAVHLALSLAGWNNNLCGHHGFRQTQTAITAYYVIKDGFRLDYITPVLGKPWSIPMEFPLYQWLVALIVLMSKIGLEQAGRLVSLVSFYLSLALIYYLLGIFEVKKPRRLIFLCLLLASPIYIFWSRAFMIESFSLFLSLLFVAAVAKAATDCRPLALFAACIIGILAGLSKVITFLFFCFPAFSIFIWLCVKERNNTGFSPKQFTYILLIFAIPLIINAAWTAYADQLKSLNPISNGFLTSEALKYWNFGTIAQKFSFFTWKKFAVSHFPRILGISFWNVKCLFILAFFVYAVFLLKKKRYSLEALLCLLFFLAGPFIFTNLYFVHDYYWYASGVFLLISVGFLILSLLEDAKWKTVAKYAIFPALILTMYFSYFKSYFILAVNNNVVYASLVNAIKEFTKTDDILLIYGFDWSSELPYYSERRALMDPFGLPYKGERFQQALRELGNDRITAMVVNKNKNKNIPVPYQKALLQYKKTKELLRNRLGREPKVEEISEHLGLARKEIEQIEIWFYRDSPNFDTDFIQERVENLKLDPKPVLQEGDIELYVAR